MAQLDGKYRWTEYRDVPTAARVIEHAPQCSGESYQTAEGGKAAAAASVTISPRCYNNNNTSNEPRASAGSTADHFPPAAFAPTHVEPPPISLSATHRKSSKRFFSLSRRIDPETRFWWIRNDKNHKNNIFFLLLLLLLFLLVLRKGKSWKHLR